MKRYWRFVFLLVFLTALLIAAPHPALACDPLPPDNSEDWVLSSSSIKGDLVPMSKITTKPGTWLQLMSSGVKLDGAVQICQKFTKGRYGWVGTVYQLVNGVWVKQPTTSGWLTDGEGEYRVCAKAKSAGTYALFAYWENPEK